MLGGGAAGGIEYYTSQVSRNCSSNVDVADCNGVQKGLARCQWGTFGMLREGCDRGRGIFCCVGIQTIVCAVYLAENHVAGQENSSFQRSLPSRWASQQTRVQRVYCVSHYCGLQFEFLFKVVASVSGWCPVFTCCFAPLNTLFNTLSLEALFLTLTWAFRTQEVCVFTTPGHRSLSLARLASSKVQPELIINNK